MPLGRFVVRNEYALGGKELYNNAVETEDPKAILDGVAVAALVGLLRQLGDLSQFAAETFHGLQEQMVSTASRSRKLVTRLQQAEASLPSIEKAILSQTSHLHFAYTPGSEWHPRIQNERNHFVCNDLPHFIMDSYEECHEPPRLQLLDRFDKSGPGSCLKRYTDPTFFRQASDSSRACNGDKSLRVRKTRSIKRRRSWQRSGQLPNPVSTSNNGRAGISSQTGRGESPLSHMVSTFDRTSRSDSLLPKEGLCFVKSLSHPGIPPIQPDRTESKELLHNMDENMVDTSTINHPHDPIPVISKDIRAASSIETTSRSSNVSWDEKLQIMEHIGLNCGIGDNVQITPEKNDCLHEQDLKRFIIKTVNQVDDLSEHRSISKPSTDNSIGDDLSELTGSSESNSDGLWDQKRRTTIDRKLTESTELTYIHEQEVKHIDVGCFSQDDPTTVLNLNMELTRKDSEIDPGQDLDETTFDFHEGDFVQAYSESLPQLPNFSEGEKALHEHNLVRGKPQCSSQATRFDKDENQLMLESQNINNNKWAIETFSANLVGVSVPLLENLSNSENIPGSIGNNLVSELDSKLGIDDVQYMLESGIISDDGTEYALTEAVNNVNVIEWHHHEDTDSETDNFVDALNTIDLESESDFETYELKELESSSMGILAENATIILMADKIDHSDTEDEYHCRSYSREDDRVYDGSEHGGMVQAFVGRSSNQTDSTKTDLGREEGCQSASYISPVTFNELELVPHVGSNTKLWNTDSEKRTAPLLLNNSECQENAESFKQSEAPFSHEQSLHNASSLSNETQGIDTEGIKLQLAVCKPATSSSQVSGDDETACPPHVSGEIPGPTSSYPHDLWTNGNLLGLQPSKPTIFSTSNSVNPAPLSSRNGNRVDQCTSKVDTQDVGSLKHNSHDVSDKKYNISLDDAGSKMNYDTFTRGLGNGHVTAHESEVLANAHLTNTFSKVVNTSEDKPLGYEDKNKPSKTLEVIPQSNLNGKLESPVTSPPPSPSLEHMKISFRPVVGFENSKLKLKYPEDVADHEMTIETFPSFQLVPESTRLHHNMGSDSDDDTFCRSYPCISEDSVGHFSDSDSVQWESGDSSKSNEHALFYDGLHRISSTKSASSPPISSRMCQLLTSDAEIMFGYEEMKACLNPEEDSFHLQDLTAQPPPLPPFQWRVSRPSSIEVDGKSEQGSNSVNQYSDSQLLKSATISDPFTDDLGKLQSRMQELETTVKQKKVPELKVVDQKQGYHSANGKTVDDRGDFLLQIRTKSFNLKRTDAARSSTPSLPTSNKITAILQKANAIRQAVGSDGEDSCWSDA